MTFGLRCSQPTCRPRPASLPIRVPTVEGLLRASFGCYTLRFATVAVIGSGWLLSSNEILPMLGTLGQRRALRRTLGPPPTGRRETPPQRMALFYSQAVWIIRTSS